MRTTVLRRAALAAAGGTALTVAYILLTGPRASPDAATPGLGATISVDPVVLGDQPPARWRPQPFADSLAARLGRTAGLAVARNADFVVHTEASTHDGRLVVAVRLLRRGEREAVWTATFWRTDESADTLVGDVAADVAEALFGYLGRQATGASRP
jgi:hypothetical protein